MSVVRTLTICAFLLTLACIMALVGCGPDRTGAPKDNAAPQVYIVNTPPDSAQFSRNPELNWYATDVDGYVALFRYSVIVDTMLMIGGVQVTPEQFIAQATDADFKWDTLIVTLDLPQSSATIRLYADTLDPVNTFISQYFFVQAQDDRGAKSDIVYRLYARNNHYPNTHHRANTLFINAVDANSAANGINVNWDGADSLDWGRTDPPLEYEWRLYGPFELDEDIYINVVQEDCVYDPTTGTYTGCRDIPVLNIDAIPDTITLNVGTDTNPVWVSKAQPLVTSQGANYANDRTDTWVSSTDATIYNVFAGMNITKTSQYKFLFWVRARDDGFVPDPTPAFSQFLVVEALFERDVALIDDNEYGRFDRWNPIHLDTTKSVFTNLIHTAGYTNFDPAQDFYWIATRTSRYNTLSTSIVPHRVTLIDVLSHKVLLYFTDTQITGLKEPPPDDAMAGRVYFGLDQGATACVFSRNITGRAGTVLAADRGVPINMSTNFARYFGIASVCPEAYSYWVLNVPGGWILNPWYREEFIGAYSANAEYPNIDVMYGDSTSQLDRRYGQWTVLPPYHSMQGLPEVGYCNKLQYATALYLYFSKLEDQSIFHGKVCAVRSAANDTRTACFLFTPLAMDPGPMQGAFTTTIDWLMEKFPSGSSASSTTESSYNATYGNLTERKQRSQEYLDYISEFASPEEKEELGINLKPFVVQQK